MRRRAFLGVLGAMLGAGCTGQGETPSEEPTETTSSSTTTATSSRSSTSAATETTSSSWSALTRREFGAWHEPVGASRAYRVAGVEFLEAVEHEERGALEIPDSERLALVRYDVENRGDEALDPMSIDAHVLGDSAHETARGVALDDADVGLDALELSRQPAWTSAELSSGEVGEFVLGAVVPAAVAAAPRRVGVTWLASREFNIIYAE